MSPPKDVSQFSVAAASTRDKKYLTPEEVAEQRYRGEIKVETLRNWRSLRIGPSFVKIGRAILYPIEALEAWEKAQTVPCDQPSVRERAHAPEDTR
jgi:hypothetical protein